MSDEHNYQFVCKALQNQVGARNAVVTHWSGTEGVSKPYRYEIVLAVKDASVSLEPLLNTPATLTAKTADGTMNWHGIITQASQEGHDDVYDFYRVVLEPRLARLRSWRWSDIYLDQQLDDIIISLLKYAQLTQPYVSDDRPYDYRIAATGMSATKQEFACQFEESCLDFLMRKLEHYGVYFWFEQGETEESVVFANDVSQQPQNAINAVHYARGTLDTESGEIAITRMDRHIGMPVEKVTLHDSPDYSNTLIDLTASHGLFKPSQLQLQGEYQSYSEHFTTLRGDDSTSGAALAKWRAQELLCASQHIKGQVRTPGVVAGYPLTVQEHRRSASLSDYYVIQISHEGYQTLETSRKNDEPPYRGSFIALPRWIMSEKGQEALQFRPQRTTSIPRIMYMVNGFIDTGTPGNAKRYAQLDDKGRYQVRFCFARQLYGGDKNSAWLRMATPYAAGNASETSLSKAGMHFPLREGTEVLISFLSGDPDRPVIVSALPNVEAPSVVTSTNAYEHLITTPAGNTLALRDASVGTVESASSSDPSIYLYSPTDNSSLNLGKTDDAPDVGDGFHLTTDTNGTIHAGTSMLIEVPGHLRMAAGGGGALNNFLGTSAQGMPPGVNISTSGGVVVSNYIGANIQSTAGASVQHFLGVKAQFTEALFAETNLAAGLKLDVSATKDLNPSSKTEIYGQHTFTFVNATWTGGNWTMAIGDKRETVATSNTQSAGTYLVASPDINLTSGLAEFSLAGPAVVLNSTGAATISSGAITEISGETCVGITSGATTFMATPSSIMATATSITLMGAGDIGLDAGVGSAVIRGTVIALG